MKELKLRSWARNLLLIIMSILFVTLSGKCDNIVTFIVSKLIALIFIYVIFTILKKYSNMFE